MSRTKRDIASIDVATLQTLVTLFSHSHAQALRLSMSWDGKRVHEALKAMLGRTSTRCQADDLAEGENALLRRQVRHYKALAESPPLRRVVNVMVVGKGWHGLYEAQLGTDDIYVALTDASLPAEAPASVGISATELARSVDQRLG
ncbi:hypothetical protein [Methylibium petroleiphilum]